MLPADAAVPIETLSLEQKTKDIEVSLLCFKLEAVQTDNNGVQT